MRLLVHVAGEADLLLDSKNRTPQAGADRVGLRLGELAVSLASPGGAADALRLLTGDAWNGQPFSTPAPSPLLGTLAALDRLDATPDLEVVVLGTTQGRGDFLDTLPIARTLADVLNRAAEDGTYIVQKATAVPVTGLAESRGQFPTDDAVVKLIWLAICDIEDKRARALAAERGKPANERTAPGRLIWPRHPGLAAGTQHTVHSVRRPYPRTHHLGEPVAGHRNQPQDRYADYIEAQKVRLGQSKIQTGQ